MSCCSDTPTAYKDLEEEYQAYESYIVNNMLMSDTGILDADAIDKTDLVYKEWTEDETISLKEFLTYAIQQNWLDITKITSDTEYMDTDEMFTTLADYISNYLYDDDNFCKQVYRYLLKEEAPQWCGDLSASVRSGRAGDGHRPHISGLSAGSI